MTEVEVTQQHFICISVYDVKCSFEYFMSDIFRNFDKVNERVGSCIERETEMKFSNEFKL